MQESQNDSVELVAEQPIESEEQVQRITFQDVRKLDVKPGQVLLFTVNTSAVRGSDLNHIGERLGRILEPLGVTPIVMTSDFQFAVVERSEIESIKAEKGSVAPASGDSE